MTTEAIKVITARQATENNKYIVGTIENTFNKAMANAIYYFSLTLKDNPNYGGFYHLDVALKSAKDGGNKVAGSCRAAIRKVATKYGIYYGKDSTSQMKKAHAVATLELFAEVVEKAMKEANAKRNAKAKTLTSDKAFTRFDNMVTSDEFNAMSQQDKDIALQKIIDKARALLSHQQRQADAA